MRVLVSVMNVGQQVTIPNVMYLIRRRIRIYRARIKSSSFFWSHLSYAGNFFTPSIFIKQNSNRTVFYDEI